MTDLRPNDACPKCGGDLHLWEDRYEQGDGQWLVCEELDCDFEMRLSDDSRAVRG